MLLLLLMLLLFYSFPKNNGCRNHRKGRNKKKKKKTHFIWSDRNHSWLDLAFKALRFELHSPFTNGLFYTANQVRQSVNGSRLGVHPSCFVPSLPSTVLKSSVPAVNLIV